MKIIYTFLFLLLSVCISRGQDSGIIPTSASKNTASVIGLSEPDFSVNKVYPNPLKNKVTIEIQAGQPGDVKLSLINILGSVVKQWEPVYLNGGGQKIQLDLTAFPSGVYFLRMTKSNQVVTQILRKN